MNSRWLGQASLIASFTRRTLTLTTAGWRQLLLPPAVLIVAGQPCSAEIAGRPEPRQRHDERMSIAPEEFGKLSTATAGTGKTCQSPWRTLHQLKLNAIGDM
jgi:hypothetical protein